MTRCGESRKEAVGPSPLLTPGKTARIVSWKVRTMYEAERTAQVAKEMMEPSGKEEAWATQELLEAKRRGRNGRIWHHLAGSRESRAALNRVRGKTVVDGLCSS